VLSFCLSISPTHARIARRAWSSKWIIYLQHILYLDALTYWLCVPRHHSHHDQNLPIARIAPTPPPGSLARLLRPCVILVSLHCVILYIFHWSRLRSTEVQESTVVGTSIDLVICKPGPPVNVSVLQILLPMPPKPKATPAMICIHRCHFFRGNAVLGPWIINQWHKPERTYYRAHFGPFYKLYKEKLLVTFSYIQLFFTCEAYIMSMLRKQMNNLIHFSWRRVGKMCFSDSYISRYEGTYIAMTHITRHTFVHETDHVTWTQPFGSTTMCSRNYLSHNIIFTLLWMKRKTQYLNKKLRLHHPYLRTEPNNNNRHHHSR
jgi:hypothetical protein